ncbi:MAG: EF-hand domain pair [Verrucomicrobiales bacterium]|nr:EF-hand domain pair [Verrucomicrobiales bacterium]
MIVTAMSSPLRSFLPLTALAVVCFSANACHNPKKLFPKIDRNGNHRLSLTEIDRAVADGFFHIYDANHDEIVTRQEWRRKDPAGEPSFYKSRDGNGDGKITKPELMDCIRDRGFSKELFNDVDRNGDGKVSEKEAAAWMADHPELLGRLKIGM